MFKGFPSASTILLVVFCTYVSYSLWTMIQLFIPPSCGSLQTKDCLRPILEDNPEFQLVAFSSIKEVPRYNSEVSLIHSSRKFDYELDWEKTINIEIPQRVRSNGTMFLHLFLTSTSAEKKWTTILKDSLSVYASVPLTHFQVPEPKSFNLLGDTTDKSQDPSSSIPPTSSSVQKTVAHFCSQVMFNILTQPIELPRNAVPYEIGRSLRLYPSGKYLPILHIDQLSMRMRDLVEITPEFVTANLTLKYSPISYGMLRMFVQFENAMDSMMNLGFTNKDIDEVKGVFSDSNLYFLIVTFVVATLHLVFDFMAFKNDISFWRDLQSMGGISPTTVVWRTFAQIVIFFYLMEEDTSLLVLIPAGIGALIELWKVTKAFHIEFVGWRPRISRALTKEENNTKDLDSEGLRYLSYVLYPLCIGGAVYSLLYTPHKSWYSWVINCLVNGIYAFGFLFMLPQLFINYKLKSVAHLPWKAFMYKAFNTFIDDLFAFVITMPTAHRVACFRDDIVFVIYLYQKWLYPVDKTRVNEFGQTGEEDKKKKD